MAGYTFPRNAQTHSALLDSIRKRKEEEERRRLLSEPMTDVLGTTTTPAWQAQQYIARQGADPTGVTKRPQPQQPQQPLPDVAPQQPPPTPYQASQPPRANQFLGLRLQDGSVTSDGLDPLGAPLMITTSPSNELEAPLIHLDQDQVDALDNVDGYLEKLQEMYPNHEVTERALHPQPTVGETLGVVGKVAWTGYEVIQGTVIEPIAQTAIEVLPWTEGALWTPGGGVGLTVADEGFYAATDKFRERPMWQQMVFGAVFDPFTLVAGLGLLKSVKLGIPLTRSVIKSAMRKMWPEISEENLDKAVTNAQKGIDEAGAGSWQGDMPKKADQTPYSPQEVLKMSGDFDDIDVDGVVPEYTPAQWDRGLERIEIERMARIGMEEEDLRSVLEKAMDADDIAMQNRILDQLAPGITDPLVRDQVFRQFIRTTIRALDAAQADDGSDWIPRDFGRSAAKALQGERAIQEARRIAVEEGGPLGADLDVLRIGSPEGGPLTTAPKFPPESVTRMGPQPTASAGRGAPARGVGEEVDLLRNTGRTPKERLEQTTYYIFDRRADLDAAKVERAASKTGSFADNLPMRAQLQMGRRAYEEAQTMFIDKFAKGNAASTRAQRAFISRMNAFVDADIVRVNKKIVDDFMAANRVTRHWAENDPRVKAAFFKRGDPGFSHIKRMPSEFNFEWQAALTSGAPGAAINHSRTVLRNVRKIIKDATGTREIILPDGSRKRVSEKLDIQYVNNYLALRHALDIIKIKGQARKAGGESGGMGLVPQSDRVLPIVNPNARTHPGNIYTRGRHTGPGGMKDYQILNHINLMVTDLKAVQVIRNVAGREVKTNQWDEMIRASKVVTDHYRNMLDMQVTEGLVSKEFAVQLKRNYKYYNPIKYVEGTIINVHDNLYRDGNQALLRGVAENDIRVLAEQGIDADMIMPLEHLSNVTMRTYLTIYRNRAMKALIPTLLLDPRNATRVRHVVDDGNELTTTLALRGKREKSGDQVRVARMINGKADVWDIPSEFEEVVDALVAFDQNMAERVLRWTNKVPRSLLTAHNPIFFTYNFMHDMLATFLVEGIMPWTVATDLMRNLKAIFTEGDGVLDEMARAGAIVGGYSGQSAEDIARGTLRSGSRLVRRDIVGGSLPQKTGGTKGKSYLDTIRGSVEDSPARGSGKADQVYREEFDTFTKWRRYATAPLRFVGDVAEAVENAPRRSVYSKVRNQPITGRLRHLRRAAGGGGKGLTMDEAAIRARRVTVDFQRRGKAVGLVDAAFLYTNAAIQGFMLPARALKTDFRGPQSRLSGSRLRMGGLAGVAAALYMWNTQEEYGDALDEMSASDKYGKLNVIVGHKWNSQFRQRIPVSIAIAPLLREFALFTAPVTYVMQKLRGRSEQAHWQQMVTALAPSMIPASHLLNIGGRDAEVGWQGPPTPTAIGGLITEIAQNKDGFRNQKIVSDAMAMNPDKRTHYDAHTSRAAIQVGKIFNQSPKLMDHWMRMGALRDIVLGVDMISRAFDPEEIDSELVAMANELDEWIEMKTPNEWVLSQDPDITETTPEGMEAQWRSQNNLRMTGLFFRDHPDFAKGVSSDERRQLRLYLDKKAREDREYSFNGEPVAFATNFVNRFIRTQGGNKSRLGMLKATEAAREQGYDISVAETREASGKLNVLMEQLQDHQLTYDSNLWMGQRTDSIGSANRSVRDAEDKPGDYMDGQQWINVHRQKGAFYAMAMYVHAGEMHRAAQLQGVDLSKKYGDWDSSTYFIRDATFWADYKTAVATGAGGWLDTRPTASHLAAGYRGITMTYLQEGVPDFTTFFEQRKDFEEMVKQQEWGPDGKKRSGEETWRLVEEEITATMTNTEFEWYQDMEHIRDYWDIARQFTERVPLGMRQTWTDYLDGNEAQRMAMKADAYTGSVITYLQQQVNDERELYRVSHPDMDAKYIKWGYAQEPMTYAGYQAKQWLLENVRTRSTMGQPTALPFAPQQPYEPTQTQPMQPTQGRQ